MELIMPVLLLLMAAAGGAILFFVIRYIRYTRFGRGRTVESILQMLFSCTDGIVRWALIFFGLLILCILLKIGVFY